MSCIWSIKEFLTQSVIIMCATCTKTKKILGKAHHCFEFLAFAYSVYQFNDQKEFDELTVVHLDFAQAFDTVPLREHIRKLKLHGTAGNLLQFITFYLHGRSQFVSTAMSKSNKGLVRVAVSKISIIGLLLFCIHYNKRPDHVANDDCFHFSDDLRLAATDKTHLQHIGFKLGSCCTLDGMILKDEENNFVNLEVILTAELKGQKNSMYKKPKIPWLECLRIMYLGWKLLPENQEGISGSLNVWEESVWSVVKWDQNKSPHKVYCDHIGARLSIKGRCEKQLEKTGECKKVQRVATKWDLKCNENYKSKLKAARLLPVCMYQQLHLTMLNQLLLRENTK